MNLSVSSSVSKLHTITCNFVVVWCLSNILVKGYLCMGDLYKKPRLGKYIMATLKSDLHEGSQWHSILSAHVTQFQL